MLKSFGDSGSGGALLADAQPFEYQSEALSEDVTELAARGAGMTGNEPGGFLLNPNGLDTDFFDANGNLSAQYHESHGEAHGQNFWDGRRDPAHCSKTNGAMPKFLIHSEYRGNAPGSGKPQVLRDRVVISARTSEEAANLLQARGNASCAVARSVYIHIMRLVRAPDDAHVQPAPAISPDEQTPP